MVRTGRHTASAQPAATASAADKDHHVRKSVLLLGICAGAQVVLLVGVGAFGHGLGHQTLSSADLSGTFLTFGRVDGSDDGSASQAPAPTAPVPVPAPDAQPVSVLGTFIRAAASGEQITAAAVPGVTSPVTVSGDSGALPVVPFQGKPPIPPDSTPPVPVTTPTPTPTPTRTPTPTPTPTITPTPTVIPTPTPTVVPPPPTPTPTVEPPTPTPTVTPPPVDPTPTPTLTEPPIPLPTPTPTLEPTPEPTPPVIPEPPIPLPTEIL